MSVAIRSSARRRVSRRSRETAALHALERAASLMYALDKHEVWRTAMLVIDSTAVLIRSQTHKSTLPIAWPESDVQSVLSRAFSTLNAGRIDLMRAEKGSK